MKKVLWVIICLMTMVIFTSCSKDDEVDNNNSIIGYWLLVSIDGKPQMHTIFYFDREKCTVGDLTCKYFINKNNINIYYKEKCRNATDAEIEYIKKQLNSARGDRVHYWREKLIEACKYTIYEFNMCGTIEKISNRELIIRFFVDTDTTSKQEIYVFEKVK